MFVILHVGVTDKGAVVYIVTYKFMWACYVHDTSNYSDWGLRWKDINREKDFKVGVLSKYKIQKQEKEAEIQGKLVEGVQSETATQMKTNTEIRDYCGLSSLSDVAFDALPPPFNGVTRRITTTCAEARL